MEIDYFHGNEQLAFFHYHLARLWPYGLSHEYKVAKLSEDEGLDLLIGLYLNIADSAYDHPDEVWRLINLRKTERLKSLMLAMATGSALYPILKELRFIISGVQTQIFHDITRPYNLSGMQPPSFTKLISESYPLQVTYGELALYRWGEQLKLSTEGINSLMDYLN